MSSPVVTEWVSFMLSDVRRSGYTFEEVMRFDDFEWDTEHGFIQWLFPNKVPSKVNLDAPVLTPVDIMVFHEDAQLRENCVRATMKFLGFLGIKWTPEGCHKALNYQRNRRYWLCDASHNHLRITRFMHFCVAIGRHDIAESLLAFLIKECHVMNTPPLTSIRYWQEAVFGCSEV